MDGVRIVGHAGSAIGQFAELLTVPERDFAVVSLSNAGPDGIPCNQAIVRWALRTYLGVTDRDPEPLPYDEAQAQAVVGSYENDAMTLTIATHRAGLMLEAALKPEVRAALDTDPGPDPAPCDLGLLPGAGTSTSSPAASSRGIAASSPATRAARSWESTSLADCSTGFRRTPSDARSVEKEVDCEKGLGASTRVAAPGS